MTAEVAILNKGAVVLAADSAVTISRGSSQEKTFDSAEKLFELSGKNHIGIMINGDLDFMESPLSVLVKKFRQSCGTCETIKDAALKFLDFLAEFGSVSPVEVVENNIRHAVQQVFAQIQDRYSKKLEEKLSSQEIFENLNGVDEFRQRLAEVRKNLLQGQIAVFGAWIDRFPDADFTGQGRMRLRRSDVNQIEAEIDRIMSGLDVDERKDLIEIGKKVLRKAGFGSAVTGIIIAGFGENELFPTLISLNINGMVSGRLKFHVQEECDVDRSGVKARVVAFAQREMVDRFLFGMDSDIERKINTFSRQGISQIRQSIFDRLNIEGDGLQSLETAALAAENAFLDGLAEQGFKAIRSEAQQEIEGMVEFMPKIEMARMAEALVNLTSIKRRLDRGMETVGGPIDVAVISHSEGLVWVKRKHYFPAELNARFFERKRAETERVEKVGHESN